MTLKLSRVSWVVRTCWNTVSGSSCRLSARGYCRAEGTFVVALGSGLAVVAVTRSEPCDHRSSPSARRALAMDSACEAVGIRCGATTTLRPVPGRSWVTARVCARNLCTAAVEAPARVMSPSKAVDSTASVTTAVVPPPIGRAAFGVYERCSRMLSLRAITLSAPADVATSTIDGSSAPFAGQAYSTDGFTWRIVSTVDTASSVAGRRWLREPEIRLPRWASDARSGSP